MTGDGAVDTTHTRSCSAAPICVHAIRICLPDTVQPSCVRIVDKPCAGERCGCVLFGKGFESALAVFSACALAARDARCLQTTHG